MLAQGIIENQGCVSFWTTNRLRLLEQIRDATWCQDTFSKVASNLSFM
jgi:hypothetical protein